MEKSVIKQSRTISAKWIAFSDCGVGQRTEYRGDYLKLRKKAQTPIRLGGIALKNLPILCSVLSVSLGIFIWYLILVAIKLEIIIVIIMVQLIISVIGLFRKSENKILIAIGIILSISPVLAYFYLSD